MTATTNANYPYATQAEYTNYAQTAGSSYHSHMTRNSSSYQYHNNLYPTNFQSDQQTNALYQSTATCDWSSSGYYDHAAQASVSYNSSSSNQRAAGAASSSSSQHAPKAKLPSSKKWAKAASTSQSRPSEDKAKMRSMLGRIRLPIGSTSMEAASPASAAGDKRKDRTSPVPGATSTAEPPTTKKARPLDVEKDKARKANKDKTQHWRDQQASDLAKLTEKLPDHMRKYTSGDKPSPQNVGQAVIHIDNLENELEQLRATRTQLLSENAAIRAEHTALRFDLLDRDKKIGNLERELQMWRCAYP
ncbi:hypothetical protein EWM64_g2773 [Hericium alpestre]|uniref:Uncharacterized protein n=1 Tax=Hericium alpestre TaxID=135208 RepID=A0A4Z0A5P1_9AGAM|nr:hypothetical protein EWM64_g2773 [Hericium alpestre]